MVQCDGESTVAVHFPPRLSRYAIEPVACHDGQCVPAPAPCQGEPEGDEDHLYVVPWRLVLLSVPGADDHWRLPDVLLRPRTDGGVCEHPADYERGGLWQHRAQYAPLGGALDGGYSDPPHDPRVLPRRVQAAARVQLGRGRRSFPRHVAAQLHGLPAPVGSDRLLGYHRRLEHGELCAAPWRAGAQLPDGAASWCRAADAGALLHAARHRVAAGRRHHDGGSLLAYPEGRR